MNRASFEKQGPGEQIRLIRTTSGMTQEQLAERIGSGQAAIARIEQSPTGNFRLATLQKIAEALQCELWIELKPRQNIDEMLERKSLEKARELIAISSGNAALELQLPEKGFVEKQVKEMQKTILKKHRASLWEKTGA